MILGSDALRPMLKACWCPMPEIIGRPRFSTLSYAGAKKLSRLPRRSAIVAFSAEEVYAVAEARAAAARRCGGGDGRALAAHAQRPGGDVSRPARSIISSPPTRSGWGSTWTWRMSPSPRSTSSTGNRQRRLTLAEMAQIAGRAGRHQRDGTFGALHAEGSNAFTPEEVLAIEAHRVPRLEHLYWREGEPRHVERRRADREPRGSGPRRGCCGRRPRRSTSRCSGGWRTKPGARSGALAGRGRAAVGGVRAARFPQARGRSDARFVGRLFGHLRRGEPATFRTNGSPMRSRGSIASRAMSRCSRGGSPRRAAGPISRTAPDWLESPAHWGRADARDRGEIVRRRIHASLDAALRRQAHDAAAAPDRRRRLQPAGGRSGRGRGERRGACAGDARRVSLHRRSRCARERQADAARGGGEAAGRELRRRGEACGAGDEELSLSVRPEVVEGRPSASDGREANALRQARGER